MRVFACLAFLFLGCLHPQFAFATELPPNVSAQVQEQLQTVRQNANISQPEDPREVAASLVRIFLSIIGTFFLV
jgi:hypothetical protein